MSNLTIYTLQHPGITLLENSSNLRFLLLLVPDLPENISGFYPAVGVGTSVDLRCIISEFLVTLGVVIG